MSGVRAFFAVAMAVLTISSSTVSLVAQGHIVSRDELRSAVVSAAQQRQADIERIHSVLDTPQLASALEKTGIRLEQVREAVPLLSNNELAQLSQRAEQLENDIAAGALTNQQITYILIALATAVIVLILVD